MSWLSRANERLTERELRTSWRQALTRLAVMTGVNTAVSAVVHAARGRSWRSGALQGAVPTVLGTLAPRVLVLWRARRRSADPER